MTEHNLPRRLVLANSIPTIEWIATDGSRYHEPFFEQTLRRLSRLPDNAGGPRHTGADAFAAVPLEVAPDAFVFHVSRCGSTLVCQVLAALEDSVVISEAPVLDDILRAHHRSASVTDADRVAWFGGAVRALGRSADTTPRRFYVKLDGWHLFELRIVRRAFPDVPFVFVYRDPLEVLVSLARHPSMALVRDTVTPDELGISAGERDALDRDELAAAVVGAYYRAALEQRDELLPIAYDELPEAVWCRTPDSGFSADEVARMRTAAARDAKEPTRAFTPDGRAKREAVTPALRAASQRWTDEPYAEWLAAVRR